MNIHHITTEADEGYYQSTEIPAADWEAAMPSTVTDVWYTYWHGSYEGSGEALIKHQDGRFVLHNLGHCSCYGPLDTDNYGRLELDPDPACCTLEQLRAASSPEALRVRGPLLDAASK